MGGVNGNGRDNGEDIFEKAVVQPFALVGGDLCFINNGQAILSQLTFQLQPAAVLLGHEFLGKLQDFLKLLGRREPIVTDFHNLFTHLAHKTCHADHEKLVEVVSRNRQKAQALQQGMVAVAGLFQHAHVKAKP